MKRAVLWIVVVALVLLGTAMVISALNVHELYPAAQGPVVFEHDQKLHKMLEEAEARQQREEYKVEFQYLTLAAVEFALAAFLAGKARRP